jgi:hypothetical protein
LRGKKKIILRNEESGDDACGFWRWKNPEKWKEGGESAKCVGVTQLLHSVTQWMLDFVSLEEWNSREKRNNLPVPFFMTVF